jgi:hypothetical protein
MNASNDNRRPGYSNRMRRLFEEVWHRCPRTPVEKDAVDWLRGQSDDRRGCARSRAEGRRHDKLLDNSPNAWVTTTFIENDLASTLRLHLANGENDYLPSLDLFGDVLKPLLREGGAIVDTTRLATRLELSQKIPVMPFIALRPAWLAAEYFDADYIVAAVSQEHHAFYQRAFGFDLWSEPRECPHFGIEVSCMGLNFNAVRDRIEATYPFLRSSKAERQSLFRRLTAPRAVMATTG